MLRGLVTLAFALLSVSTARAQPMLRTVETVDWMAADSSVVVRAAVVDFVREAEADEKKWITVVLKVRETLKGKHQPFHTYVTPDWNHEDIARWRKTEQEMLFFLADTKLPEKFP